MRKLLGVALTCLTLGAFDASRAPAGAAAAVERVAETGSPSISGQKGHPRHSARRLDRRGAAPDRWRMPLGAEPAPPPEPIPSPHYYWRV